MLPRGTSNDGMVSKARNAGISPANLSQPAGLATTEFATCDEPGHSCDERSVQANNAAGTPAVTLCAGSQPIDMSVVHRNLWLFIWLKTIGSHDSGAFSAAIASSNGIAESWELTYSRQGTLASSVFLGNILGCPLAGHLFSAFGEKNVLIVSLVVHTAFTFLFAFVANYYVALVNRFVIGLTLAFIVVYTPVWVDEFAPKERQSMWMASHNAGVPVGIMIGYILAAFFSTYTDIGWEWAFYIKCMLMIPTIAYIAKVNKNTIDTNKQRAVNGLAEQQDHDSDGCTNSIRDEELHMVGSQTGVAGALNKCSARVNTAWRGLWKSLLPIVTNVIFMCSALAMSSLYFVATGLQNFVTQYLREEPFNASMRTIMAGFGASVVTAPVCGVIVGGILLDHLGGYQRNLFRVSLFACGSGVIAACFAIICIFVTTTTGFLIVMSAVLFCGGAIIPPGLGLTMSTLAPHLRSKAAAFSQTLYNLLGNFSGPMVCGQVAALTGELKYGIMVLLLSSVLGVIPMAVILRLAWRARSATRSLLDVPDAVAIVATTTADNERGYNPIDEGEVLTSTAKHTMQNESFEGRSGVGEDELPNVHATPATSVPFPLAAPSATAAVLPPGRVQLADVRSARWKGASAGASTTNAAASSANAHFSPLRAPSGAVGGGVPDSAAAAMPTPLMFRAGSEYGDARGVTQSSTPSGPASGRFTSRDRDWASISDVGTDVASELDAESTQALQAMPTPYVFGMDVVRTLLHPATIGTGSGAPQATPARRPRSQSQPNTNQNTPAEGSL